MPSRASSRPTAIVQARMGSTRLPGKVLLPILGRPVLWHIVRRLRFADGLTNVVVATSELPADAPVRQFCAANGIPAFAGSENDVLDRFYKAACKFEADPVIRITGDCPFVDPQLVARLLTLFQEGWDHVGVAAGAGSLRTECRFPDGLDAECFSFATLQRAWREATSELDREHVTPYIWRNRELFRCTSLLAEKDHSQLRLTIDHEADFDLASRIYAALYRDGPPFVLDDVLRYLSAHPELIDSNCHLVGQEGYENFWQHGPKVDEAR